MTGYKFKLQNAAGQYIYLNDFTTDEDRFLGLQEYPDMNVEVKNNEAAKEGQHGIFDFFSYYGKRTIAFTGVIIGNTEADVETQKAQLLRVTSLPPIPSATNDGTITISWTDANGDDWQVEGKIMGYPKFDRPLRQNFLLKFTLTIKCPNPEIESQILLTTSGLRGWQQGVLHLPATIPATFDLIYNNELSVDNDGTLEAHTLIKLTGEDGLTVTNPYILNETTGKMFKVNITLNGLAEYIIISSKDGTVVDQDGNDQSALVDGASEYILLALGTNKLVFLSDESWGALSPVNTWVDPEAEVEVSHRTTVI